MSLSILDLVGIFANFTGALGAIISAFGVLRILLVQRRAAQPIALVLRLETEGKELALPLEMRRRDVTRAELLGRLGMLPMRKVGARFSIRHISKPGFMRAINEVADGKVSQLVIPVTEDEFAQFDLGE